MGTPHLSQLWRSLCHAELRKTKLTGENSIKETLLGSDDGYESRALGEMKIGQQTVPGVWVWMGGQAFCPPSCLLRALTIHIRGWLHSLHLLPPLAAPGASGPPAESPAQHAASTLGRCLQATHNTEKRCFFQNQGRLGSAQMFAGKHCSLRVALLQCALDLLYGSHKGMQLHPRNRFDMQQWKFCIKFFRELAGRRPCICTGLFLRVLRQYPNLLNL